MNDNLKKIIKAVIISALVVVSIYIVLEDINFDELWNILLNADYLWVILSIPVILISHLIRAVRWKILLKPILDAKSYWNLFSAVMVGYGVNSVTGRGGEFVRPYVYARREGVSRSAVFATIIVERVIDVVYLLGLFAFAFFIFSERISQAFPWLTEERLLIFVVLPVVLLVLGILAVIYTSIGSFLLRIFVKPLSLKIYERLLQILTSFLKGLEFIRTPKQYLRVVFDSTLLWAFYALPLYLMFYSFSFTTRFDMGFLDATLLLIVSGIAVTVAPTPGAIGVYHAVVSQAMINLYGIHREEALAFATLTHAVNILIQFVVGGGFFLRENLTHLPKNSSNDKENDIDVKTSEIVS